MMDSVVIDDPIRGEMLYLQNQLKKLRGSSLYIEDVKQNHSSGMV